MTGRAVARANGGTPVLSAAAGRKGFKAELDDLRERMRGLGLGFEEIAGEMARRYRLRPREAYRLAYGWTLDHAAARFNAHAAREGTDPQARAGLTGPRLCEYEKWPFSERKPSAYVLLMLAQVYETDVLCLLDLDDHENLPPRDRVTLIRRPTAGKLANVEGQAMTGTHRSLVPSQSLSTAQGIWLPLPFVPGRLVIEVSDLSTANTGWAVPETDCTELANGQLALVQQIPHQG